MEWTEPLSSPPCALASGHGPQSILSKASCNQLYQRRRRWRYKLLAAPNPTAGASVETFHKRCAHTYIHISNTIIHTITRMHTVLHLIKLFGSYVLTYTQTSLSITLSATLHPDFSVKHSAPIGNFNLLLFFFLLARFFFSFGCSESECIGVFSAG